MYKEHPDFSGKAMYTISGYEFYNTSWFILKEILNDSDHIANFKSYL